MDARCRGDRIAVDSRLCLQKMLANSSYCKQTIAIKTLNRQQFSSPRFDFARAFGLFLVEMQVVELVY